MESILARCVAGALVLAAALPFLPVGSWAVRVFDFPRVQLATAALVAATIVGLRAAVTTRSGEAWLLAGVMLLVAAWQASRVLALTPVWPHEVAAAEPIHRCIDVCVANLEYDNTNRAAFVQQAQDAQHDVLLLIEINSDWSRALEPLHADYPHRLGVDLDEGRGLWLFSKLPLSDTRVRYLVSESRPSVWATLTTREGRSVRLVGLHPTPPGLYDADREERHDSRIRDAELMLVAREVAADRDARWLVMGDFNDVAWSHTTRLFKRLSGLRDPRVGRGLYNTYHADWPLFRFPIDHVFLSPSARVRSLSRIRVQGSDHFAITAAIAFPDSQGVDPQPAPGDRVESLELIEEGKADVESGDSAPIESAVDDRAATD